MPSLKWTTTTSAFLSAVPVKSLAVGIAAGIIFDATVIRALLVPALMKLFGEANWWMPAWLDRLLPASAGERVVDLRDPVPVPLAAAASAADV
jgi:RND superfamily putative drug exporter